MTGAKTTLTQADGRRLAAKIQDWARALGFAEASVAPTDLGEHEARLLQWLEDGWHGEMSYMRRHGTRRSRPRALRPGTLSVVSVRMDYLNTGMARGARTLDDPERAYVARYALGRDYHKLMRKRLQKLADRITAEVGPFGYRAFTDSAPVLEKALAERAGLGWLGKHTLALNRAAGSWFLLGELYTDLPLPPAPARRDAHCGACARCIDACPTKAIVAPYRLDARRCISYLTIEHKSAIPVEFRRAIGNRIFGCDDCQLACPWNRFAPRTAEADFQPRNGLDDARLIDLFAWSEDEFDRRLRGSAIRRIGHAKWLANIAIALGNAPCSRGALAALKARAGHPAAPVREHVAWAIAEQTAKCRAARDGASGAS